MQGHLVNAKIQQEQEKGHQKIEKEHQQIVGTPRTSVKGPSELQCRDTHNLSGTRDDSQLPPPCCEQQPGPAAPLPGAAGTQEHHWEKTSQVHIRTDQRHAENSKVQSSAILVTYQFNQKSVEKSKVVQSTVDS